MNTYDDHNPEGRDPVAELLSQTLSEEAAMVEPTPGSLQSIQQRTKPKSRVRDPWVFGAFGAGLATAAVITAVVVVGNNGSDPSGANAPAATQGNETDQPTQSGEPTGTAVEQPAFHQGVYDPNADPANQFTMYYVGPDPKNMELESRLFPETHTVETADNTDPVTAVHEFLTSTPIDPDYTSHWPEGVDVSTITEDAGVTTIALTGEVGDVALGTDPLPVPYAQWRNAAVQALLWTAGIDGKASFTYNGAPLDLVLFTEASTSRAPEDDYRAFLTIDNIVEGQTVTNPVTVRVSGNVHEGNVNWKLLDAEGTELDNGYTTTSMGMWTQADIDLGTLEPGTYTIKVIEYSMEDGSVQNSDDKTFTVE
jgi:hypothetical protein